QPVFLQQEVPRISTLTQGDHGRMFTKKQMVDRLLIMAGRFGTDVLLEELFLVIPGLLVGNTPEIPPQHRLRGGGYACHHTKISNLPRSLLPSRLRCYSGYFLSMMRNVVPLPTSEDFTNIRP